MALSVYNNILSMNADRMLGINKSKKTQSMQKLSSGYKVNRAADDAANLAISEKMRRLIRGLAQGTENAQDGISWVQIGDGALNEAQEMLQRMNELAIKSMNGTNSDSDRAAMDAEFTQLKKEMNRVSAATKFNDINIFSKHQEHWYQTMGDKKWDFGQIHNIVEGDNSITFEYCLSNSRALRTATFSVPPGEYTTVELIDEIDTAIMEQMDGFDTWFQVELAEDGRVNVNLEGGTYIDTVTGGLSYLLYDMYKGGGTGALLGTTIFTTDTDTLDIVAGRNDYMEFDIEDLKGNSKTVRFTVPEGSYTREQLIDKLNNDTPLKDTSVKAEPYGRSIKLGSAKEFVTRFKGNMFSIDGPDYTSVFYDNVKEGTVDQFPAVFKGGAVLIEDGNSTDSEHKLLIFDKTNNKLTLRPNETADSVTIEIPEGSYNLSGIMNKLQQLLDEKFKDENNRPMLVVETTPGQTVNVGSYYSPYYGSNRTYAQFKGLTITTTAKGPACGVHIDENSSAYDTLFRDRKYVYYGPKADISQYDFTADRDASFTGSKNLGNISGTAPLTLTDKNNTFQISLKGTDDKASRTEIIELAAGDYNTKEDLVKAVNDQLRAKNLDDLIQAKLTGDGRLQIVEAAGGDVNGYISVGAAPGSAGASETENGYRMLFVVADVTHFSKTENSTDGVCSFDTPGHADSSTMRITVNGKPYNVNLGSDLNDPAKMAQAITDQLKGETITSDIGFSSRPTAGTTTVDSFSQYTPVAGKDTVSHWNDTKTGTSGKKEGETGGTPSTPAVLTIAPTLKDSMHIDKNNNRIRLTVNDRTETLQLTDDNVPEDFSMEGLRKRLQEKIDAVFGTGTKGAKVELKGNQLILTSGLKGDDSKLSCGTSNSSFLSWLRTTKTPASCTSTNRMTGNIVITDGTNDKLKFNYRGQGEANANSVELDLRGGSYTPQTLTGEINEQLKAKGLDGKIKATCDSYNRLVLTTTDAGDGVNISFDTGGSTAADPMFGLTTKTPAYVSTSQPIKNSITIDPDKREFKLYVDNTPDGVVNPTEVKVELDSGTYDRNSFLNMLKGKLAGTGVTVSLARDPYTYNYNTLRFETTESGKGTKVEISYEDLNSNPKSAMQAIYGTSTVTYPAVEASFDANNKLTLTAKNADGSVNKKANISVTSDTSAGLLADGQRIEDKPCESKSGYHTRKKAAIDGVSFKDYSLDGVDRQAGTVEINQYNKDLYFRIQRRVNDYYTYDSYSLVLDEKTYTYAELAKALQDKLDAANSPVRGGVEVTVNTDGGVDIRAKNYGGTYRFETVSGGFYDKVLSAGATKSEKLNVEDVLGSQKVNGAYTVGRKDVTGGAEIVYGVSDTLSFDLKAKDQTVHIKMTLSAGKYDPQELVKHIQEKLDEQLADKGFRPGLVQVGIGGIQSGIAGSNDDKALNFRISDTVQANVAGDYMIDGIGGNAAFEIFYQTEGKVIPAYVMGAKDVRNGVTIVEGKTDLSFVVDGTAYELELTPGEYTAKGIVDEIKRALGPDAPLTASINPEDGRVKISYTELGHHEFGPVTGGARTEVFFNENGGSDNTDRHIQLSSQVSDRTLLKRSEFNAKMLRIDSLSIASQKFASKAIGRVSKAIDRVSVLRIEFGSMQNRLEHAMNNNQNKEENLEHADSVIRDTDMAQEVLRLATYNMLEQVSASMLSQANKKGEEVLNLLKS